MKFTFVEAELLNSFYEFIEPGTKSEVIEELEQAKSNTDDKDIINIANSVIQKVYMLDDETFKKVFDDFPLNEFTNY